MPITIMTTMTITTMTTMSMKTMTTTAITVTIPTMRVTINVAHGRNHNNYV